MNYLAFKTFLTLLTVTFFSAAGVHNKCVYDDDRVPNIQKSKLIKK